MKQNTKAIIYARSAGGNAKPGELTAQDQVEAMRKYCKANNIEAVMEITEFGSGSEMYNSGLTEQIKYASKNQHSCDVVVTHDISRISRNPAVINKFMKELKKLGVQLHLVKENLPTELAMTMAKMQSKQLSDRIKAGINRKKQEQDSNRMVRFTAKGRNGKKFKYQKEVVKQTVTRRIN
jgi:DNA invertase Pin-like site-specific DNA recombinase